MASPLNDQFEHGRIPLKPLPYANKDVAQKSELMVDYTGANPSYHIYIVDSADGNKVIDITSHMVKEAFGSSITVHIEGMEEPMTLHDLMNFIYKRFVYPDDIDGYVYARDHEKVLDPNNAVLVLLRDVDGRYYLPITRADAIIDNSGRTVQERLDTLSRLGFSNDYISVVEEGQNVFEINYPFINYFSNGNYMELRVGTTFIDKTRYQVIDKYDEDGNAYGCTVTFFNDKFEVGRRIDILFMYNATGISQGEYYAITGGQIANFTIPVTKLEKYSSSFYNQDATSVATNKAVYDLYNTFCEMLGAASNRAFFCVDQDTTRPDRITINLYADKVKLSDYYVLATILVNGTLKHNKVQLRVTNGTNAPDTIVINDVPIPDGVGDGKIIKIMLNKDKAIALNVTDLHLSSTRYIYTAKDQENTIYFKDLDYTRNSNIKIYRNGVRLFKDLDYIIDMNNQSIYVFVRTEEGERFVFESEFIEY